MIIKKYVLGMCQTNCYLIVDENSKECAIIDVGDVCPQLEEDIDAGNYSVKHIIFTHGHFDHIGGLEYYMLKYDKSTVLMHKNDVEAIACNYDVFCANMKDKEKTLKNITLHNDGDIFTLGDTKLRIIYTKITFVYIIL